MVDPEGAMNEVAWEVEVELAFELFACNGDPDAFREDLGHLGFQPDEIDKYMQWEPS